MQRKGTVDGPDGPLYADFHALRHTYLTLGGRAGIDLRTLQELAGHSTPTLTARSSHRRLYDLAGAVEKLPTEEDTEAHSLRATGTDALEPATATSTGSEQRTIGCRNASTAVDVGCTKVAYSSGNRMRFVDSD